MRVTLEVARQAASGAERRFDRYEIEAPPNASVHDCLEKVALEVDATLALRENCFAGVCGECGLRVNQLERQGCQTRLVDLAPAGAEAIALTVEPMRNHRVLRDLIVDRADHFQRLARAGATFVPGAPRLVDDATMKRLQSTTRCIQCGLCLSACEAYPAKPDFLGPAALAWLARFLDDPRDGVHPDRRRLAARPDGTAGCVECGRCDEVCPEKIRPLAAIRAMRDAEAGA